MTHSILLFGATGQIGGALARRMIKNQVPFKALVRDPQKAKSIRHTQVELLEGDLADRDTLKKALKGIEKVFLCSSTHPNQVELQGNAVEMAYHAGVKHIVKISAFGTDKESSVNLLKWHAVTEEQIKNYQFAHTFLRPHMFMQGLLAFAPSIKKSKSFSAPLRSAICMVDVEDIAEVAFKALISSEHENNTYTISGPEALSYDKVAQILSDVLHQTIRYEPISYDDAQHNMVEQGLPDWLAEDLVRLYRLFNMGIANFVSPTVEDITGHKPNSLQAWLQQHINQWQ